MAVSNHPQGYQCEFIDSVSEDFYCKKCTLVARRLSMISCCGESYCHACIADTQEQGKPCPECGEKEFTFFYHMKTQKRINNLQVFCTMKERGCDWSGTLEQLDTHLDPDQDNCQYVDTKCPLNCHLTIPKDKVEQHVAQHCAKRPCVCQHCNFKATYEEVVDKHLPECKYVPLQCPNLCGVTFERDFMEDHMKMCRLEEVGCEFSGVGCDDQFRREDQEEHTRQNSQKHLTLTASLAVESKEHLQQKLLEQDKKYKEEVEKLKQKIEELKKKLFSLDKEHKEDEQKLKQKLEEQEEKLERQENKLIKQEKMLDEQAKKLETRDRELDEQKLKFLGETQQCTKSEYQLIHQQLKTELWILYSHLGLSLTFTMIDFSKVKNESSSWRSPAMYTHLYGYKFFFEIKANGYGGGRGKAVRVDLWSTPGDFDSQLKWPVKVKITLELVNQHGGDNLVNYKDGVTWKKPDESVYITLIGSKCHLGNGHFIDHSELGDFLKNDSLDFHASTVVL